MLIITWALLLLAAIVFIVTALVPERLRAIRACMAVVVTTMVGLAVYVAQWKAGSSVLEAAVTVGLTCLFVGFLAVSVALPHDNRPRPNGFAR